ncbi:MAG: LamG domain-containing protein [Dehalococcoidia bacterium]|nr:LamG domain-containing protein [Dehalococcoidia bacterium]
MRNADNPTCQEVFNNHQFFLRTKPEGEDATNPFETFVNLSDGSVEPRASSGVASDIGKWFFVAATWDETTLKIYVNGEFKGQSPRAGALVSTPVTAQIGRGEQKDLTANSFNGIIDDVAFFSVVLEEEDIKTLMDQGLKDSFITAVDLSGKLATTWGEVKARY